VLLAAPQEAAGLMAAGDYEAALACAMDAVKQGQELFKGGPALQMFPLYLLAGQASGALAACRVSPCPACFSSTRRRAWRLADRAVLHRRRPTWGCGGCSRRATS
jgi:hypothetical protein